MNIEFSDLTSEKFKIFLTIRVTKYNDPEDIVDRLEHSKKEVPFVITADYTLHIISYGYHGDLRHRGHFTPEDVIETGRIRPEGFTIQFDNKLEGLLRLDCAQAKAYKNIIKEKIEVYIGRALKSDY
jgi:hypothetical protein